MQSKISERQAIDNLTRQTDYRGLCAHLIASAKKISGVTVTLYEAHDEAGRANLNNVEIEKIVLRRFPAQKNVKHPSWFGDAIRGLEETYDLSRIDVAGTSEHIFPIGELNGIWRFLYVEKVNDKKSLETLEHLSQIFANLLGVLDRFERDALTGLLNRQSFDYRFEDLLEHHQRNPYRTKVESMPWLAIIDIDHFKSINDSYGHLFGDEILLLFARLLRDCFRFDDLLFRYGGEEFIVILNNTDAQGAELALERFRTLIQDYEFPTVESVTTSIGWAAVRPKEAANTIIHKADRALYHAKSHGRNLTVNFEETFADDASGALSEVDVFD